MILAAWLAVNALWLAADDRQPIFDAAFHASKALDLAWSVGGDAELSSLQVLQHYVYPPFVYVASLPAAWMTFHADGLILWMDLLFGCLLVGSLYGMGRSLGIPWAVPGAVLLTLCHPVTLFNTRVFMLAFPLAAMVTCAYWLVLESEHRWTPRNGALLGAVLGLGLLTKWSFVLYVAPAVVWLGYRLARGGRLRMGWPSAMVAVVATMLICGPWYVWILPEVVDTLRHNIWESQVDRNDPPGWSVAGWLAYTGRYLSVVPFAAWALAAGVIAATAARRARPLLYWFLAGYALLAFAPTVKDIRFFLPLVPLMSLVTWWGLGQLRPDWCRRIALAGLAVWCVTQVAIQSIPWVEQSLREPFPGKLSLFGRRHFDTGPALPMPDESAVMPVMNHMVTYTSAPGQWTRSLLLASDNIYTVDTFFYEASRRERQMLHLFDVLEQLAGMDVEAMWRKPYDFVVIREPPGELPLSVRDRSIRAFGQRVRQATSRYRLVDRWTVDGGDGVVELYARHEDTG